MDKPKPAQRKQPFIQSWLKVLGKALFSLPTTRYREATMPRRRAGISGYGWRTINPHASVNSTGRAATRRHARWAAGLRKERAAEAARKEGQHALGYTESPKPFSARKIQRVFKRNSTKYLNQSEA